MKMSVWSLGCQQSIFRRYHSEKKIYWSFAHKMAAKASWQWNYVTVTLCISSYTHYPQNDDRIVATDSATSRNPVYSIPVGTRRRVVACRRRRRRPARRYRRTTTGHRTNWRHGTRPPCWTGNSATPRRAHVTSSTSSRTWHITHAGGWRGAALSLAAFVARTKLTHVGPG